jgi:hypothetical protein
MSRKQSKSVEQVVARPVAVAAVRWDWKVAAEPVGDLTDAIVGLLIDLYYTKLKPAVDNATKAA